jgi:hypothetical protein
MSSLRLFCIAFLLISTAACHSAPLRIQTPPVGPNEKTVGYTEGSSTGIMLFQFIPINQNDRFVNAYNEALQKVGASRLTDVTIEERWFWAWVLNGYIFKVKGTAVIEKS